MDKIIIATACNNKIRVYIADTTILVSKACDIHFGINKDRFSEFLTACAVTGAMNQKNTCTAFLLLENKHSWFCRTEGTLLKAEVNQNNLNNNNLLIITKKIGHKNDYTSSIELESKRLADAFSAFFSKSEGVATRIVLSPNKAVFVQSMPGANMEELNNFADTIDIENIPSFLKTIDILFTLPVSYYCDCSINYFVETIKRLDESSKENIFETDNIIKITCPYCGKLYVINKKMIF